MQAQSAQSQTSSRDKRRNQPMADPNTGNSLTITEAPDLVPHIQFSMNNLEQVRLPDIPEDSRRRSDIEKDHAMRERFGPHGPGELLNKSSQQMRRDMLQEQQDVDGLPWEVRWRRALIPTSEEIVQDIRDRFDLYVQDPIDREQEWYLHWKDRGFKVQKDRMIWPQGYTDYLDHYDELGRRRVLPTDQRWSDSSWKHLADTQYRDRMWLIEGEERTAIHRSLQSERVLIQEEEERQLEMGNVLYGLTTGVVDLDPDQTYQALAGTADPMEVARTKMKLQAYGAGQALEGNKATNPALLDPISGFPKADMEPLGSGLTVEQGAALLTQAKLHHERFEQRADASTQVGKDPTVTYMTDLANASKGFDDRPVLRAQVEGGVKTFKRLQEEEGRVASGESEAKISKVGHLLDRIEAGVMDAAAGKGVTSIPTTKAEGFIPIGPRPAGSEPNIPNELSSVPRKNDVETMPEWYRISLVNTEPLIQSYRMVADPLEMLPGKSEYYVPPEVTLEGRITEDDARGGVSAFDEMKMHKLRSIPELTESFKPLPLFRETSGDGAVEGGEQGCAGMTSATLTGDDGRLLKKSERLRRERQERLRKAKVEFDPDILLPSLPWETDSIVDPYRGVEKGLALANFNKSDAEKTWHAYRDTFKQALTEYGNLAQVTNEARCEAMLYDTIERFRRGEVGDHPSVPEEQEAVYKLLFEGHTKHFLADFYKIKGNRATEANTLKAEGDGLIRQASSKSKLLGKAFMDFIQEMTSLELDAIRKCPVQRHAMLLHDKKYEVLAKPFSRWIQKDLADFTRTEFQASEQLETHREFLIRLVNGMRDRLPMRVEGIPDAARDATVEALFQWCRGAISFYCGQQLHRMYLHFAETRFRSRAEQLFEESFEYFSNYHKVGQNYVQIPIPNSEPPYEYEEKEFLDGESAVIAELTGNLEKAEGIWHSGSTKRWYPLVDETEYILFNERRGRLTLALDMSDRCLENVNKKTHPSIHPFPERARIFLEGAPLTQETAEHLWLRYMGDLYSEHSELMTRQGRFQTGRAHREKSLKLYHLAIRTARERLPPSWRAPLLTEAHYRMRCFDSTDDVATHVEEVEVVVEKLFVQKEPRHWLDLATDLPHRVALVQVNLPAYGELITKEVVRRIGWQPSNELLMKNFEQRVQGGPTLPELESYMRTSNEVAEKVFRQKILRWRAKEVEDSDPYLFWTYLYFTFCVYPNHHEEVQKLWDMYEPAFLYIYTHCALALPQRGQKLINEALRRLCQILLPGNTEQRKCLLAELTKVREKMAHLVDTAELDRTIVTLVDNLADPRRLTYVYGTSLLHQDAIAQERLRNNPLLRSQMASRDYAELQERVAEVRRNADTLDPHRAAQMTEQQSFHRGDTPLGSQPDLSTKQMFEGA